MGYAADKVKTETKSVPATTSSQDIEKKNEIIHVYMDTTYTYTTRTVRNEIYQEEDTSWTRKGHYFQALVGAGYGSMGYGIKDLQAGLKNARNDGGFNWLAQFNYVYYFHENVGFMVGLMAEQMNSYSLLNGTKTWTSNGDSDNGEEYSHTVTMKDWKEIRLADGVRAFEELAPVLAGKAAGPDVLYIDPAFLRKQTVHQHPPGQFQGENGRAFPVAEHGVLDDV